MKEVNSQNLWNFAFSSQEIMKDPIWIVVGFQQKDRQDSENVNNDCFFRSPVATAQCILGEEKCLDAGISLDHDEYYYSHVYGVIKEAFRSPTKDDIFQPYLSDHDFSIDIGYNLFNFRIRCQ